MKIFKEKEFLKTVFQSTIISLTESKYSIFGHRYSFFSAGFVVFLVAFFSFTVGLRFVSFVTAFNDTQHVWEYNSSTSGDYSVSNITIDDTGAYPNFRNEITNAGFEDSASGWHDGSELDIDSGLFTAKMSKRNGGGPFAQGVYGQGDFVGEPYSPLSDKIQPNTTNTLIASSLKTYSDGSQGTVVFWITPEWNGDDGKLHMIMNTNTDVAIYKNIHGNLVLYDWGVQYLTNISDWVAGNTYMVTFRWDKKNPIGDGKYLSITINDDPPVLSKTSPIVVGWYLRAIHGGDSIIEGLTVYRRVLFDGTYGVDIGHGDEITQIYNAGTGKDPTMITGSWDVVFDLPTNSSAGEITTGVGQAWSHPHGSNVLYTDTSNTGGFLMGGNYETDGWEDHGAIDPDSIDFNGSSTTVNCGSDSSLDDLPLSDFTVEGWLRNTNDLGPNYQGLIEKRTGNGWLVRLAGGTNPKNIDFIADFGTDARTYSSAAAAIGEWIHWAVVWDAATKSADIYINGVLNNGSKTAATGDYVSDSVEDVLMGYNSYYLEGTQGWVRISSGKRYDTTFTPSSRFSPPVGDQNTIAQWNMDEGSGAAVSNDGGVDSCGGIPGNCDGVMVDGVWNDGGQLIGAEKIYNSGYKWTNFMENQGIKRTASGLTVGRDYVVRGIAHSDGTSVPKIQIWDVTNDHEISQMTAADASSTRTNPENFLFTFELPYISRYNTVDGDGEFDWVDADCTEIEVRLLNTQADGTVYWHQVELYENYFDNPSFEIGDGDPWIPHGYTNISGYLLSGDTSKKTSPCNSGASCFAYHQTVHSNAGIQASASGIANGFYSSGVWGKVSSGNIGLSNPGYSIRNYGYNSWPSANIYIGSEEKYHVMVHNYYTSGYSGIGLRRWYTGTNDGYADDAYTFRLSDISLTVTPSSKINSTETLPDSTSGLRVDGLDTLTESVSEITQDSGVFRFTFSPRHSFDIAENFGYASPVIFESYGDDNNYIKLYKVSDTILRLTGVFDGAGVGGTVNADWDGSVDPIVLDAGSMYSVEIQYENGNHLALLIDGIEKVSVPLEYRFSVVPSTVFYGSDHSGSNQYDAVYANSGQSATFSDDAINQRYGLNAVEVDATAVTRLVTQGVNVGDTSTHTFSAYVYNNTEGEIGGAINDSVAELFYHGTVIPTTYSDLGGGWYKLTGQVTGENALRSYGLQVKSGKKVLLDDSTVVRDVVQELYSLNVYSSPIVQIWDIITENTVITGDHAEIRYQVCNDDVSVCESDGWLFWNGSAWMVASDERDSNTSAELITETTVGTETRYPLQWLSPENKKFAIKAIFFEEGESTIRLLDTTLGLTTDTTPPEDIDESMITLRRLAGGDAIAAGDWTNQQQIHVSWTGVNDNFGGSGIRGYCMYLGQDGSVDPADPSLESNKGLLGDSPEDVTGTSCDFIVGSVAEVDFANVDYRGDVWLESNADPYYINIVAVDNSGNTSSVVSSFPFGFDDIPPLPPDYVSLPSGYVSTKDVTMTWPASGGSAASDDLSGVLGLQYRINTGNPWYGDLHEGSGTWSDLLVSDGSYTMDETHDYPLLDEGENVIYIRAWDAAGNISTEYTTGALKLNTNAPSSPRNLVVEPVDNDDNNYAFSWDPPSTYLGQVEDISYCYTVNTLPGVNTCNWTSAGITSLSAEAYATQPGENTMYVVARDEAGNINFGTFISVEFTYSGLAPGIPGSLEVSDVSIKSVSSWKLAVSWSDPEEVGAGIHHYDIYRSTEEEASCASQFSDFVMIGSTGGTSYIDSDLDQVEYYYCAKACDSANNCSAPSGTVHMLPTGRFYEPSELVVAPNVVAVSTKSVSVEWVTDRDSDSVIQYGVESGEYYEDEVYKSAQTPQHQITLTNLNPDTTYFFRAKWTDEDGNTGMSSEYICKTLPPPSVASVYVKSVNLDSADIVFTTLNATKADVYYGASSAYGGIQTINTSENESTYSVELNGLDDGTEYHYRIALYDKDGHKYEVLEDKVFTTLPRPKIQNVKFQQARDAASPTIVVSWDSNTEISSSVEYYPSEAGIPKNELAKTILELEHKVLIEGLTPDTPYSLVVRGTDRMGNSAESDVYTFTTASDTRSPRIFDVAVEVNELPVGYRGDTGDAQLVVSWSTDEQATSQVEYGEGTGSTYTSKTSEDQNYTMDHVVVVSNLNPSTVYHLRVISKDGAKNESHSIDIVAITPKASASGVDVIMKIVNQIVGN